MTEPYIDCIGCGHRWYGYKTPTQDELEYVARRDYGWTHGASGWLCRDCTNEGHVYGVDDYEADKGTQ